jgi:CRP/FNR family transcriptional regulator
MDAVDEAVKRSKPIQKNQPLYEVGDAFTSVFAARSGAVKTFTIDEEGEEPFIGFYLPGELVGLDVIGTEAYTNTAKALETSSLCEIPFDSTAELSQKINNLQLHVYKLLSKEIREDQELQMLLSKKTAAERIAAFLFNLAERYLAPGPRSARPKGDNCKLAGQPASVQSNTSCQGNCRSKRSRRRYGHTTTAPSHRQHLRRWNMTS